MMVQDLFLAFKADNIEASFILSDIGFYKLGPGLDIMTVPKCAVYVFLRGKYFHLGKDRFVLLQQFSKLDFLS